MMTPEELAAYAKVMREHGLRRLRLGDVEMEAHEAGRAPTSLLGVEAQTAAVERLMQDADEGDDDRWLYAATEGYPSPPSKASNVDGEA